MDKERPSPSPVDVIDTPPGSRLTLALVPLGIALNITLGGLVQLVKLPIYLDAVGTITVTLLAGWRAGALTGVLSFVIGSVLLNPVLVWFSGTQVAIALYVHLVGRHGGFGSTFLTVASGIGLGVVAGVVSAPIIAHVFGGITGSGSSLIVAYLVASGRSLVRSVALSGLASEPIDKTLQVLLSVWLLHGMPKSLLTRFSGGSLRESAFLPGPATGHRQDVL